MRDRQSETLANIGIFSLRETPAGIVVTLTQQPSSEERIHPGRFYHENLGKSPLPAYIRSFYRIPAMSGKACLSPNPSGNGIAQQMIRENCSKSRDHETLQKTLRRGGRVVECGGLENRCARKCTEGSNPSLSAIWRFQDAPYSPKSPVKSGLFLFWGLR